MTQERVSSLACTYTLPPAATFTSPLMSATVWVSITITAPEPATLARPTEMPTAMSMYFSCATACTSTSPRTLIVLAKAGPVCASVAKVFLSPLPIQAFVSPRTTGTAAPAEPEKPSDAAAPTPAATSERLRAAST